MYKILPEKPNSKLASCHVKVYMQCQFELLYAGKYKVSPRPSLKKVVLLLYVHPSLYITLSWGNFYAILPRILKARAYRVDKLSTSCEGMHSVIVFKCFKVQFSAKNVPCVYMYA